VEIIFEALLHDDDNRGLSNVDARPLAGKFLRGCDGGAASTERIENSIALVRGELNKTQPSENVPIWDTKKPMRRKTTGRKPAHLESEDRTPHEEAKWLSYAGSMPETRRMSLKIRSSKSERSRPRSS
jgi:hypothetical protein